MSSRTFSLGFCMICILSATALCCLPSLAQQSKVLAPHKPVPPIGSPAKLHYKPPVPRSLIGGLWMTDGNMKSYLHITNHLVTSSLSVTPVLWLSNGTKLSLPSVNLDPSGTAIVSINQALADQGLAPYATLSGYVELDYQWSWDVLCATVRNVDVSHSVIFSYGLSLAFAVDAPPTTLRELQNLEGLWWKHEAKVTGFVALSNPGSEAISANLAVSDALGKPIGQSSVTVSPHGTKVLDLAGLPEVAGSSGGLRVTYNGAPNDLLVSGGLRDDATGYSANIGFKPPPGGTQTITMSYAELGLMTGASDPMLAFPAGTVFTPYAIARNISSQPVVITPNLWWMEGGAAKTASSPRFTLAPFQSKNLNVPALLAQAGLKDYNGSVNLVLDVTANAQHGSVLLASGSVDQKNTYVFEVAPEAVKESIAKSLSYWSTANGDDTMVTIWNPADEAQDFLFTLFYTGGHYRYPLHLEPRAALMFNISEILHTAIPDAEGNIIPTGIRDGSAELSGSQGETQYILVDFDAGTYNVQKATCSQFCKTCEGIVDSQVLGNPFYVLPNGIEQLEFYLRNNNGTWSNYTAFTDTSWSSSNTQVATVNTSPGMVTGVARGSVTISAFSNSAPVYGNFCEVYAFTCPDQTGWGGSADGTVQVPTASRVTGTLISHSLSSGSSPCASGQAGWYRQVEKIVTDQNGTDMMFAGQNLAEVLTVGAPNALGTSGTVTGTARTDANGYFNDTFYTCSPRCPASSGQANATQTISDKLPTGGAPYSLSPNTLVYKCTGITVNGQ